MQRETRLSKKVREKFGHQIGENRKAMRYMDLAHFLHSAYIVNIRWRNKCLFDCVDLLFK